MDAREIAFMRNAGGKQEATLDLLLVVFDDNGKALHNVIRNVNFNLEQARYDEMLKNGVLITTDSEAPPKSARVRLIVHDAASGLLGSVDLPLGP